MEEKDAEGGESRGEGNTALLFPHVYRPRLRLCITPLTRSLLPFSPSLAGTTENPRLRLSLYNLEIFKEGRKVLLATDRKNRALVLKARSTPESPPGLRRLGSRGGWRGEKHFTEAPWALFAKGRERKKERNGKRGLMKSGNPVKSSHKLAFLPPAFLLGAGWIARVALSSSFSRRTREARTDSAPGNF